MQYLLIVVYILLLPITIIAFLWKILDTVEKIKEERQQQPVEPVKKEIRKHTSIEKSNFNNAFGGRKTYEIFKNTNGLYEPVTPSKGIELKKKEE